MILGGWGGLTTDTLCRRDTHFTIIQTTGSQDRQGMSRPQISFLYMWVSINGGTPKWLVYNGKNHCN